MRSHVVTRSRLVRVVFGIGALTSFGSNSRVSAEKARRMLGWKPSAATIWDDLTSDYYRSL